MNRSPWIFTAWIFLTLSAGAHSEHKIENTSAHHEDHQDDHLEDHDSEKEQSFELSPEAEKNFAIQKLLLSSKGPWEIPRSAVVTTQLETNIYRYRDGHYQRIDFRQVKKKENFLVVDSPDLQKGDAIVTQGVALLRIAEISALQGAPEGHSH